MFYCGECATERQWPTTMFKSHGRCETCGKTAVCNDTPSSLLPASPVDSPVIPEVEDKTAMEQLAQRLCDAANGSDRYQSPGFRGADADKQLAESGVKPEGFVMSPEELTARQAEKREMLQALYTPETPVDAPTVQQAQWDAEIECLRQWECPSCGTEHSMQLHSPVMGLPARMSCRSCGANYPVPPTEDEAAESRVAYFGRLRLNHEGPTWPQRSSRHCELCKLLRVLDFDVVRGSTRTSAEMPNTYQLQQLTVEEAALAKLPNAVRLSNGRIEVTKGVRESLGDDVLRKLNDSPDAEIVTIGEEAQPENDKLLITARQLARGDLIYRMKAPSAIEFATFDSPLEVIYVGVGELDEGGPAVTFGVKGEMIRWAVPPETQLGVTHA